MRTIGLYFLLAVISIFYQNSNEISELINYANPLIGKVPSKTNSILKYNIDIEINFQVIPSVTVPFYKKNCTLQSRNLETKSVAPYYFKDSLITGFRGIQCLSGSSTKDYCSFTIMLECGYLNCLPYPRGIEYSHINEVSTSPYYKTNLKI